MKHSSMLCLMATVTVLGGCAGMKKKQAKYVPEEKKVISYTDSIARIDNKIKGSHLVITKHPLIGKKFETKECVVAAPVAKPAAQPVQKPQQKGFGSLLGGLTKMVGSAKKSTGLGPKPVAQPEGKTIQEDFFTDDAVVFNINYRSDINHIVGFNDVTFILRDPMGKIHKPVSVKELLNRKGATCGSKEQIAKFKSVTKNVSDLWKVVALPKESITTALAFRPDDINMKGKWTLEMYEVPVMTDAAGKVNETNHWRGTRIVRKWETTYKKSTPTSDFKAIKKVEL